MNSVNALELDSGQKKSQLNDLAGFLYSAEKEGFEPSVRFWRTAV